MRFHVQSCWWNDSDSCRWRPGLCLLLCAACHLHMCISSLLRKQSAASCSCLRLCCYSSTDASRSAHQLTEDRCNPEQDNTKRSQTAPGNVHRKEWVQVEVLLCDNSAFKSVFLVNVRNQEIWYVFFLCFQKPIRFGQRKDRVYWSSHKSPVRKVKTWR